MTTSILNDWLNESEENKKLYAEESLILEVSEMIWDELKKRELSKADLASATGTSKSHISQLLNGSRNMTLRTLADIAFALNMVPRFHLSDEDETAGWAKIGSVIQAHSQKSPLNEDFFVATEGDSNWTKPIHVGYWKANAA